MASRQKPEVKTRQFPERPSQLQANAAAANAAQNDDTPEEDEDDDDDDETDAYAPVDRIRRSYHLASQSSAQEKSSPRQSETIQVTLDEGYFARERRFVVSQLANARQKLSSLRMFNPIQNETVKQQQQEWTEKEKYTLDSLNEFNGPLGERFRFDKPDDGREVWPSKLQYFLAITSYSIGLSNVIRFPILVQRNGGLAFIIPFVVMLLVEGIPLFYLELAIGQRTRKAAISCWNLVSPFAVGIGIASATVSFLIGLYYNTVVAWTLLYSWASLTRGLPPGATGAPGDATDTVCSQAQHSPPTQSPSLAAANLPDKTTNLGINETAECLNTSPFEYFWYRETLNISSGVSDWAHFNWPVAACLGLAWLISYLCLVRGLSTSKQLVYVVSTFPYVILCVFLVKALSLRGMSSGLSYFIEPDWPKLFDPYVWLQAAAQVFFSLGLGFGGLIALSSYNQVNNNCYRDAIKVCLINFVTSLLAGIVVFAILGFRATMNFERCQMEREQQIDFYMADYNLKALEYGAAFGQVATKKADKDQRRQGDLKNVDEFVAVRRNDNGQNETDLLEEADNDKKFSLEDAIDSIRSLDRQLDLGSPSGSFDYGDSDTEFILNASNVIDPETLDSIVSNIEGLPTCSIKRELDESTRGPGLIFVVMAEAISQFESNANYWQIVFFLMILALGLDSQFGNLEGLLSSLTDYNFNINFKLLNDQHSTPDGAIADDAISNQDRSNRLHLHHHHHLNNLSNGLATSPAEEHKQQQHLQALKLSQNQLIRKWATGCICGLSLLISIVMFAHGAGSYMLAIFDEYASNFSLVIIALFELLAISYIYGLKRFSAECELMTGKRPPFLVLLSWRYISPILLLLLVFATINQFTIELDYEVWQPEEGNDESSHLVQASWPYWAIVFGGLLIVCCVVWIPLIAALRAIKINIVPEEQQQRWFPADELREYHQLQDHEYQVSKFERIFFGFKQDDD